MYNSKNLTRLLHKYYFHIKLFQFLLTHRNFQEWLSAHWLTCSSRRSQPCGGVSLAPERWRCRFPSGQESAWRERFRSGQSPCTAQCAAFRSCSPSNPCAPERSKASPGWWHREWLSPLPWSTSLRGRRDRWNRQWQQKPAKTDIKRKTITNYYVQSLCDCTEEDLHRYCFIGLNYIYFSHIFLNMCKSFLNTWPHVLEFNINNVKLAHDHLLDTVLTPFRGMTSSLIQFTLCYKKHSSVKG